MGSGGFFVQSEHFINAHQGRIGDVSIYGQEYNHTTWQLAAMNMAIRGSTLTLASNQPIPSPTISTRIYVLISLWRIHHLT